MGGLTAQEAWRGHIWKAAALLAFAAWLVLVGVHHEPWFDEAQAWLIARDNSPYEILSHRVRYEGSPGLWHLLLWLVIRLGMVFGELHWLSGACAVAGAAILLWRAPFPPLLRIAILASYFFGYQYAIVARSYALDLLLFPLLASWFDRRAERPIRYAVVIGLIANANAHGFVAAAVIGLEFLFALLRSGGKTQRDAWIAAGIASLLGTIAIVTTWQPPDNAALAIHPPRGIQAAAQFLLDAFVDRPTPWTTTDPSPLAVQIGLLATLLLLAPSLLLIRRAGHLWLAIGLFFALIAFSALQYASSWHAGLLFLSWLFCLWISWDRVSDRPLRRTALFSALLICGVQACETLRTGAEDIAQRYSAAPEAARQIGFWRREHPQGRIAVLGAQAFAVQPWFPANIFANYHDGASRPSYLLWSTREPLQPATASADWGRLLAGKPDLIVASLSQISPDAFADDLRMACAAGYYHPVLIGGATLWKGYPLRDDSLALLERRSDNAPSCD